MLWTSRCGGPRPEQDELSSLRKEHGDLRSEVVRRLDGGSVPVEALASSWRRDSEASDQLSPPDKSHRNLPLAGLPASLRNPPPLQKCTASPHVGVPGNPLLHDLVRGGGQCL